MKRFLCLLPVALLLTGAGSGCAILSKGASGMMGNMAGGLAASLQKQTDLQLVEEGSPAFLLLLDGLLESSPNDPKLLIATSEAYSAYVAGFAGKEASTRAAAMYAKARDYALRALEMNPSFRKARQGSIDDFEAALKTFRRKDVPALYAAASAWMGWIISSSGSAEALAQMPKAMALLGRSHALDPAWRGGGSEMFFGIYYAVNPATRSLEKSKAHFERAFTFAGPDAMLPRVTFAEFYARYAFDRDLFEKTLRAVVAHKTADPANNLLNEVARQRAANLLQRADDIF